MITPLRDLCLLEKVEDELSPGGLHLVSQDVQKIGKAKVVAVGRDVGRPRVRYFVPRRSESTSISAIDDETHVFYVDVGSIPPDEVPAYMDRVKQNLQHPDGVVITPDDTVLYSVYGAQEVKDTDGKKFLHAPEKEILAVLK